jgi:uncharacterized protein (TIGR04168 family)
VSMVSRDRQSENRCQQQPAQEIHSSDLLASPTIKIAVVGDVHDLWDERDGLALKHLGVDLVLLVGDFGNESVEVVEAIAQLDIPKAAILGNHDAWYTATDWGRKLRSTDTQGNRVQQQLDLLGATHVGYGKLDVPELGLTVVGGRPFSWGGSAWKNEEFYQSYYNVASFEESTAKILKAVEGAAYDTVIFVGHCGPTGLGEEPEDLCGKDWKPIGGDHGDPDLEAAIAQTRSSGKTVPLVAFGHMHHQLRHTKERLRKMIEVDPSGTVYLNAARVPRILQTDAGQVHHFALVTLQAGVVTQASNIWVDQNFAVQSESPLYQQPQPEICLKS